MAARKGCKKTGGRKKGTPNKIMADIKAAFREHGQALVAVEGGSFKVARRLPLAATLKRELRAFKRRITPRRNDTFNGAGVHDDLLIAAALVCWQAGRR